MFWSRRQDKIIKTVICGENEQEHIGVEFQGNMTDYCILFYSYLVEDALIPSPIKINTFLYWLLKEMYHDKNFANKNCSGY